MTEAFIVDAVRTPIGRRGGGLASVHPLDLGAHVLTELIDRTGIDPGAVDDVIFGCLDQIGPQAGDIARLSWLAAGLPQHVPGVTVDRQCGSSQQAVTFAAQAVKSETADLVVAGGVQSMSAIPILASFEAGKPYGFEDPYSGSEGWSKHIGGEEISQFRAADVIAERWDLSREQLEDFAVSSHTRALAAVGAGVFDGEISPINGEISPINGVRHDEGPRRPDLDKIRSLKVLRPDGRHTAATASQTSDAAAAVLVASQAAIDRFHLTPRARVHHVSALADDPVVMLTAPIPATKRALERTGMSIDDIDSVEINEAFASVVLAWMAELGADPGKVNPNGGAIALGHPLGATGARLITSLLGELERTGGRYGMVTMCEGGGQANVTIIERLG